VDRRQSDVKPLFLRDYLLAALHRYFLIASSIQAQFKQIQEAQDYKEKVYSLSTNDFVIYLLSGPPCLYFIWCGMLLTVIEGYQELHLQDVQVDKLLQQTTRVDVLRRCRNGIFHFQKDYFDDHFVAPMRDLFFTQWAIDLTAALGLSIENAIKSPGPSPQLAPNTFADHL
jgi:hypothetical protein